ncbi:EF-hand domain-containing protein [Alkanindiges sp. WGS2144]|uniref:EF-hand domain-containing protein n=1 Tax=Alkanindiges sp. WGS2144 TaxID=3366808 RepID=UPI0037535501
MKTLSTTLLAAILGLGLAVSAIAAPTTTQASSTTTANKDSQRAERMAKMQAEQAALFQQADANKDGKLSEAEFAKFNELKKAAWEARKQEFEKNRFARLDTNKDGVLSMDELKAGHGKKGGFKHRKNAHQQVQKPAI